MAHRFFFLACFFLCNHAYSQQHPADVLRMQAEQLYNKDKYDLALSKYQDALKIVEGKDDNRTANLCVDISSIYHLKNNYKTALQYCRKGLALLKPSIPDSTRFKLYSSTGTMYKNLHRKDSLSMYYRLVDELLTKNKGVVKQIPIYVLHHYNILGRWYLRNGEYSKSIFYLDKANAVAEEYSLYNEVPFIQTNRADVNEFLGNYVTALTLRMAALKNYKKRDIYYCQNLIGLGWTYFKLKKLDEAEKYYRKAFDFFYTFLQKEELKYMDTEILLYSNLINILDLKNQDRQAFQLIEKGIEKYKKLMGNKGRPLAFLYLRKAKIMTKNKNFDEAVQLLKEAENSNSFEESHAEKLSLSEKESVIDLQVWELITYQRAGVFLDKFHQNKKKQDLKTSLKYYVLCAKLINYTEELLDLSSYSHENEYKDIYSKILNILVDNKSLFSKTEFEELVFNIIENARYNRLKKILQLNTIKPSVIPEKLLAREQKLLQDIARVKTLENEKKKEEYFQLKTEWFKLLETFEREYPQYFALKYKNTDYTIQDVQRNLADNTAYINYYLENKQLYVVVITSRKREVLVYPVYDKFKEDLDFLKNAITVNPALGKYQGMEASVRCYNLLIEPLKKIIANCTRLIISKDLSFNLLPFEILETGVQKNDYLFREYAITYTYGTPLLLNKSSIYARNTLIVAPFARPEATQGAKARDGAIQWLESSEEEVTHIDGTPLIGNYATKDKFVKRDFRNKVIHFATHAEANDKNPNNSFIRFYPDKDAELYAEDIYNLPLSETPLVVLGACNGENGVNVQGEGIISLAYSFTYAGCPAIISTIWSANDKTTAYISIRLHHYLRKGYDKDLALQQARQDFFNSEYFAKFNHPYFWANYVLIGSNSAVFKDTNYSLSYYIFGSISVVCLLLYFNRNIFSKKSTI